MTHGEFVALMRTALCRVEDEQDGEEDIEDLGEAIDNLISEFADAAKESGHEIDLSGDEDDDEDENDEDEEE